METITASFPRKRESTLLSIIDGIVRIDSRFRANDAVIHKFIREEIGQMSFGRTLQEAGLFSCRGVPAGDRVPRADAGWKISNPPAGVLVPPCLVL
jgi:hypothetical protein